MNLKKVIKGKKMLGLILAILMVAPMTLNFVPQGLNEAKAEGAESTYVKAEVGQTIGDCFPDEIFSKYVYETVLKKGTWNSSMGQDKLTAEDITKIEAVTEISFANQTELEDLTGIQNFKSLTKLSCVIPKLEELDVSKNTKLEYLDVNQTKITNLDLTKNRELKYLSVGEIASLDVSNNLKLESLYTGTSLTSLDVSKNTALNYIDCSSSKLKALDLTGKRLGDDKIEENGSSDISGQKPDFEYIEIADGKYKILNMPLDGKVKDLKINGTEYTGSLTSDIIVDKVPTKIEYNYATGGINDSNEEAIIMDVTSNKVSLAKVEKVELTNEEKGVSISGTFTNGSVLKIENLKEDDNNYKLLLDKIAENLKSLGKIQDALFSFDVSIVNGSYVPGSKMILTFDVGTQYNGRIAIVKHLLANGGIESLEVIVENGKVQIEVTELSPFMVAIAKDAPEQIPGGEDDNNKVNTEETSATTQETSASSVKTGDNAPISALFAMAAMSALALGVTFKRKQDI